MAAKRPSAKEPPQRRSSAEKIGPTGGTAESRVLLLFEQMQGQIQGIADGVIGLNRRLDEVRTDLLAQIDEKTQILAATIRQNSADIRTSSDEILALKQAVERIELALESKDSAEKVKALELRVSRLESTA